MSLTLYGAPLSPFVRKVPPAPGRKGLDYQLEAIARSASRPGIARSVRWAASRRCATATWPSPTPA